MLPAVLRLARAAAIPLALGVTAGALAASGDQPPPHVAALAWEAAATGPAEVLIELRDKADLAPADHMTRREDKALFVVGALRAIADRAQADLRKWLAEQRVPCRPFYIVDVVWARADRDTIAAIAARPDVSRVLFNPWVKGLADQPHALPRGPETGAARAPESVEWNVDRVGAPIAWAEGHRGEGIVIGDQDTGQRWTHESLQPHYRGWDAGSGTASHDYNWHDAIHAPATGGICGPDSPFPCDDNGHGTHTAGTTVGADGGANETGVAPGATWIGCRNMDQGNGSPATYLECFEFFLAPYPVAGDPSMGDPLMAPDVTTNSWICPPSEGCAWDVLQDAVIAQRAAGIMTVVAAGNSGSSCGTIDAPPAVYDAAFTVGATDFGDGMAGFSSRGPSAPNGLVKPDIVAPGVGIRSSTSGADDTYGAGSGTSMATPHVAGVVALLWSARPAYRGHVAETEALLDATARRLPSIVEGCGGDYVAGPNGTWGHGLVDVGALLARACQPPVEALCNDGFDSDCDGLLDCDDADCDGSGACAEAGRCTDGRDNDADAASDCADPECDGDAACPESAACSDTRDNDLDGATDCDDADCDASGACAEAGRCGDGRDNDGDASSDCADPDCDGDAACPESAACSDARDNDLDGATDCDDADCDGSGACAEAGRCTDGRDNDGDASSDCADPDCDGDAACPESAACTDARDNDLDGATDCDDADCDGSGACAEAGRCTDGRDNDGDAATDCTDRDCDGDSACPESAACTDARDNDLDGAADCDDADCDGSGACAEAGRCADGRDNDGDVSSDCADPDCDGDAACPESAACADSRDNDLDGAADCDDADCDGSGACAEAGRCADGRDNDGDASTDCADPDCDGDAACPESAACADSRDNDLDGAADCDDADCDGSGACAEAGRCADGRDNDGDASTDCADPDCDGDSACPESAACTDARDNDADGATDCADADCASDAACAALDLDGDGHPNASDCAPADATVFAPAPEVGRVDVARFGGQVMLAWDDLSPRAGPGVRYEISAAPLGFLLAARVAAFPCVVRDHAGTSWLAALPPLDEAFLVRGVTSCGPAPAQGWGRDSLGRERPACP